MSDDAASRAKRGRSSRARGRDYQSAVARRWRNIGLFPEAASTQGAQTRAVGKVASDISGTPFTVECKYQKNVNIKAAIRQAEEQGDTKCVVIAHMANEPFGSALAVMRLRQWEALVRKAGLCGREPLPLPELEFSGPEPGSQELTGTTEEEE